MKKFNDMRVGVKLALGFTLMLVLFLVSGVQSIISTRILNNEYLNLIDIESKKGKYLDDGNAYVKDMGIATLYFIIQKDDKFISDFDKAESDFDGNLKKIEELTTDQKEIDELMNIKNAEEKYVAEIHNVFNALKSNDMIVYNKALADAKELRNSFSSDLEILVEQSNQNITDNEKALSNRANINQIVTITIAILATAISIFIGIIIVLSIKKPLQKVITILDDIEKGNGDLTKRIDYDSKDEIGILSGLFDKFMYKLEQMIIQIKQSTSSVSNASEEIAAGNQDLAQRTQEQAASIEETSAAIEQLTATVKQNSENAQKTNKMSGKTAEIVIEGNEVIKQTITAMEEVNISSKKIADIINVVNEIAFQTNLLALNAAVEAARAGEQGRGFAVVAVEVRNLAGRSAQAAKEIQSLINDSVEKITVGNRLVLKTGDNLDKITQSITEMSELISEISTASREQSLGIEQVNTSIVQMDDVTQQNASLVEEAAASSQAMSAEAQHLYQLTKGFKVSGSSNVDEIKRSNMKDPKRNTEHSRSENYEDFDKF